jgi:hypothetical protein
MNLDVFTYTHHDEEDMDSLHENCSSGKRLAGIIRSIIENMEDPIEGDNIKQLRINAAELDAGSNPCDLAA